MLEKGARTACADVLPCSTTGFLEPTLLLRLKFQQAESQAIGPLHHCLNFRSVDDAHVLRESLANDVPQSFVFLGSGRESVISSDRKVCVVPELQASSTEFLLGQIFEANDFIFVGDFIHLRMNDELLSGAVNNWRALSTLETNASVETVGSTAVRGAQL